VFYLLHEEGFFVGASSGLNVAAAVQVLLQLQHIVTIEASSLKALFQLNYAEMSLHILCVFCTRLLIISVQDTQSRHACVTQVK
jgi:cysteine synthase